MYVTVPSQLTPRTQRRTSSRSTPKRDACTALQAQRQGSTEACVWVVSRRVAPPPPLHHSLKQRNDQTHAATLTSPTAEQVVRFKAENARCAFLEGAGMRLELIEVCASFSGLCYRVRGALRCRGGVCGREVQKPPPPLSAESFVALLGMCTSLATGLCLYSWLSFGVAGYQYYSLTWEFHAAGSSVHICFLATRSC